MTTTSPPTYRAAMTALFEKAKKEDMLGPKNIGYFQGKYLTKENFSVAYAELHVSIVSDPQLARLAGHYSVTVSEEAANIAIQSKETRSLRDGKGRTIAQCAMEQSIFAVRYAQAHQSEDPVLAEAVAFAAKIWILDESNFDIKRDMEKLLMHVSFHDNETIARLINAGKINRGNVNTYTERAESNLWSRALSRGNAEAARMFRELSCGPSDEELERRHKLAEERSHFIPVHNAALIRTTTP